MPGITFRDDVEEARRTNLKARDVPESSSTTLESPPTPRVTKTVCIAIVLALLLGAGGTVLGILNIVDDNETISVASAGNSTEGSTTDQTGQGKTSYDISRTIDAIRERGTLRCGLPFANTPGKTMFQLEKNPKLFKTIDRNSPCTSSHTRNYCDFHRLCRSSG